MSVKNNIIQLSPHTCLAESTSKSTAQSLILTKSSLEVVGKIAKFYDKNIVEFALDGLEFNHVCQKRIVDLMENILELK